MAAHHPGDQHPTDEHPDTERIDPDTEADTDTPAPPMNRAERRAAARGVVATPKVAGPGVGQAPPPPARKRNYAARKGG